MQRNVKNSISVEEYRERNLAKINHKDFQHGIMSVAEALGFKVYFTWKSVHSPPGYPDLTLASAEQRRLIFIELKTMKDELSAAQIDWADRIIDSATLRRDVDFPMLTPEFYVIKPSDWDVLQALLMDIKNAKLSTIYSTYESQRGSLVLQAKEQARRYQKNNLGGSKCRSI